jgi:DNA-binding SARP family transcriptional activator
MTTFDIRLFGAIEIRRDGELLTDFRSQKALVLLAYLICENRPVTRDYLAGLGWPEMEQSQALGLLRRSLHDLNNQLPGCLAMDRRTVHFSPTEPATIDIYTLANLIALSDRDHGDIAAGADVAFLYRAPFLHGIYVDDAPELESWLLGEQERWQQVATRVLQRLIQHHTDEAAYALALRYVQQLLALEPWREEVQRQAMLLLARTGQVSAALLQYEHCRHILQAELAVEPAPETERLYAKIKAITQAPPPNLLAATTPFIGRTAELAELPRLLAKPNNRLITILGPGGMGKTRLSLEVARNVVSEQRRVFLQGVCVVALAGTDSAAQFVSALAQALAFTVQPQSPPADQLIHYLCDKEMLLLLDNFEQLVDDLACAA